MLFTIQPRLIQPCRVQLQNCKSWMLHILLCTFFPPPYTHAVIYSLPCLCLKVTAIWGRLLAPGGGLHCSVLSCWPLVAGVFDSSFEEQLKKKEQCSPASCVSETSIRFLHHIDSQTAVWYSTTTFIPCGVLFPHLCLFRMHPLTF